MAITRKSFSSSLVAKNPIYCNDFYTLKGSTKSYTDFFSYQSIEALTDLNDVRTNNYSNIFLGKNQYISDWLQIKQKKDSALDLTSTLYFLPSKSANPTNEGIWLSFDKSYTFFDFDFDTAPYKLTKGKSTDENTENYFFNIKCVSDSQCKISHGFGEFTYYLRIDGKLTITFMCDGNDENCLFNYVQEGNQLRLYKNVVTRNESGAITQTKIYTLGYKTDSEKGYVLTAFEGINASDASILYVALAQNQLEGYLDTAWVGYDQKSSITHINLDKSAFHIKSQTMFHQQYSKDDGINFVPLKNTITYNNSYTRGDNLTSSSENYPDVNFRNYTALHTGLNQEKGNDNIILTYKFNDQVYNLRDGETFEWKIPTIEENEGKNPLWPYNRLNIKDSKFKKNGAMASDVPYFADKVYRLQGRNTTVRDGNGQNLSPNNGTYLCTWLYQPDANTSAVWLDRYYYPDRTSRKAALNSPHFEESFENLIDKDYNTEAVATFIRENTYFDKVSDLVFEPGNEYKYVRMSSKVVDDVVETLNDFLIDSVVDQYDDMESLHNLLEFNGNRYLRIDESLLHRTNALTFNSDIYIMKDRPMGLQIFGADYTTGLSIQNRKDVVPFHYYSTEKIIYLLNNEYEIKHQFDVFTKYHDIINNFIIGEPFEDVIVISNLYLYILTWDLTLKARVYYGDILDISQVKVNGMLNNLLSYPYIKIQWHMNSTGEQKIHFGQNEVIIPRSKIERLVDATVRIHYKHDPGIYYFESNISKVLSNGSAQIYNGNVYVPYEHDVLKLIFVPDSPKDNFTENDVKNHPCKARILESGEYAINYLRTGNGSTKEPTLENQFIEVEDKLKQIYIDKKGKIYAFNYDKLAVSPDGDTVYGLYNWDKYIASGGWYWIYNQSLSRMHAQIATAKFAEFGSEESIDFIRFNELGMMCLIRGFGGIELSENRRMEIYDETKLRVYQWPLDSYEKVYSLDAFKYVGDDKRDHLSFVVIAKLTDLDQLERIEYKCTDLRLTEKEVKLPLDVLSRFTETTNTNANMRHVNENKIYFNLYLPNIYLQNYRESIEWDLEDAQTGWYNINVFVDLDAAKFEVKINDKDYANRNESMNFLPYVNSYGNIFDLSYYVGAVGRNYGTTMHRILYDELDDRYACNNCKMENTMVFTKRLSYHEYQAIRLKGHKINPISLTLPAGQHNNIEEVVRYFKYVPPTAISNKIKINISGTGFNTKGEFELLENEIRNRLSDEKDCLVDIEKIEFV